jgi:hypothetical protein
MNAMMMVVYWERLEAEYMEAWLDGRASVEFVILARSQVKQWWSLVGE